MSLGGYCRVGWRCGTKPRANGAVFLTHAQLAELIYRKRPSAKMRGLRAFGIEFAGRPDGTPVVSREHVEARPGVNPRTVKRSPRNL